jgi:tyrosyl-tRNA synthetase
MMWRYYELLTDVQVPEIEKMKRDVAAALAHPMTRKKELARKIVADFHSAEAATKADEDWAKQFQMDEVPEQISTVQVRFGDIVNVPLQEIEFDCKDGVVFLSGARYKGVRLDKLLVQCGLAASLSEASRKIKEGAVIVGHQLQRGPYFLLKELPQTVPVRLGKRVKMANIVR